MRRVVKEPEERRNELIDIAEALFMEKGYDYTTVEEIVTKAQVAKGTFYHYFKSKSDILDAMIDRYITEIDKSMREIVLREGMDTVEKMFEIFRFFRGFRNNRSTFVDYIHDEKNARTHVKVEQKFVPVFVHTFADIINQGVQQGVFNTKYPAEAALAILSLSLQFGNAHQSYVTDERRRVEAGLDIIERIVGAEPGTFLNVYKEVKKWTEEGS